MGGWRGWEAGERDGSMTGWFDDLGFRRGHTGHMGFNAQFPVSTVRPYTQEPITYDLLVNCELLLHAAS